MVFLVLHPSLSPPCDLHIAETFRWHFSDISLKMHKAHRLQLEEKERVYFL